MNLPRRGLILSCVAVATATTPSVSCDSHSLPDAAKQAGARRSLAKPQPAAPRWTTPQLTTLEICEQVLDVKLPEGDRPTPDEAEALRGCSSLDLYHGLGKRADPVKARKCAFIGMDDDNREVWNRSMLGNRNLLVMMYANGIGTDRNYEAALSIACVDYRRYNQSELLIKELFSRKWKRWRGKDLNVCDFAVRTQEDALCVWLEERQKRQKREAPLKRIVANWTDAQRAAFHELQQSWEMFIEAHAGEIDLRHSNRSITVDRERASLEAELLAALRKFEAGHHLRLRALAVDACPRIGGDTGYLW